MSHWLDKVLTILTSDTNDLRELMHIAEGNPKTFYAASNLHGVNLSGQDLRGITLPPIDPSKTTIDSAMQLDPDTVVLRKDESRRPPIAVDRFVFDVKQALANKEYGLAIDIASYGLSMYPNDVHLLRLKGRGLFFIGLLEEAWGIFDSLSDSADRTPTDLIFLIDIHGARGEASEEESLAHLGLSLFPGFAEFYIRLARVAAQRGDIAGALSVGLQLQRRGVSKALSLYRVAQLFHDKSLRIRYFEELLSLGRDTNTARKLVALKLEVGDFDGALLTAEEAIRWFPHALHAWKLLARVFVVRGEQERVVDVWRRACEVFPDNETVWRRLIVSLGDRTEALVVLREAMRLFPSGDNVAEWEKTTARLKALEEPEV